MIGNPFSVIVVLIVATSFASAYSDFTEELPLYLSDDILIAKVGRISKRSLIKDLEIETTGRERITKRDSEKDSGKTKNPSVEVKEKPNESDDELENKEESSIVFLPSFRKRTRREVNDDVSNKNKQPTERNEELLNTETQDEQESGIVFLPSFGRRTRRSLVKRDSLSSNVDSISKNTNSETEKNKSEEHNSKEKKNSPNKDDFDENDSEEKQESGIVFLPSFGRRTRSIMKRNSPSSKDDSVAENTNSDTEKNKSEEHDSKEKKNTSTKDESDENDSEEKQESGIVFLPSFGRRTRRSILKRDSHSSKDDSIAKNTNSETEKKKSEEHDSNEKKNSPTKDNSDENDSEEKQESGIVFLPSFGRRTRRSLFKRNAPPESINDSTKIKENSETIKNKPVKGDATNQTAKKQSKSSSKDENSDESSDDSEEKQESGIVFLPSFGRRTRRDTSEEAEKVGEGESIHSHNDESNEFDEDEEESGIVFLPSFGRRTRRQLP